MVEEARNHSVRRERTDISFRAILVVLVCAIAFAVVVQFVLLVFFYDYRDYQARIKRSPFPLAPTPSEALPPEPRLEQLDRMSGIENSSVYQRQLSKEDVLRSYGTTDDEGFLRIPIGQAMDYLQKKLPARAGPQPSRRKDSGLVTGGESNSGRVFRERP
jgi:hypothetical protein